MKKYLFLTLAGIFFIFGVALAGTTTPAQGNKSAMPWPCPRWAWSNGQQLQIVTVKGTVTSFSPPVAVLKTSKGDIYLRLGPWWFWQQQGYTLRQGEKVEAQGYMFNNYLVPVKIKTSTGEIVLRDKAGFPIWRAAMGRGMGRGRGFWGNSSANGTAPMPGRGMGGGYGRGRGMGGYVR
jgi:hypothetical protein